MSQAVPSPCMNICTMDPATGWCQGCLRTLDEIAAWSSMPELAKQGVWLELGRRRIVWRRLQQAGRDANPTLDAA